MELHRNSLGDDYLPQPSSSKVTHRAASPTSASLAQTYGRSSSPISHDSGLEKGTYAETFIVSNTIMIKYIYIVGILAKHQPVGVYIGLSVNSVC